MKRIVVVLAALGLLGMGAAVRADEKNETRTEKKSDRTGSSATTERSTKHNGAKVDEKTDVEHHVRHDGTTETKRHVKKKAKVAGRALPHKTESKERTVRDSRGNVIEHEEKQK